MKLMRSKLGEMGQFMIRLLVDHSYALFALVTLDFLFGGVALYLGEHGRLSIARAYYEHFFIFFGNQSSLIVERLSKIYSVFDATMGILVIPSILAILVGREMSRMTTELRLEGLLIELGERKGLPPHEARERASHVLRILKEESKKVSDT